ncbi:hypothetical protein H4219_002749 [Mycoemilia scoparia]|uniref:Uncharacterized protein n=1 Tax=Mycoemilia scoparia TaxID=417184 RepID=A0A9W7ZWN2_9FUNG|nr:hypothetical protein H4219_002749 [Mycoemilia scoparia]
MNTTPPPENPPNYTPFPGPEEVTLDSGTGTPIVRVTPAHLVVNPSDPRHYSTQSYYTELYNANRPRNSIPAGSVSHQNTLRPPILPPRRTQSVNSLHSSQSAQDIADVAGAANSGSSSHEAPLIQLDDDEPLPGSTENVSSRPNQLYSPTNNNSSVSFRSHTPQLPPRRDSSTTTASNIPIPPPRTTSGLHPSLSQPAHSAASGYGHYSHSPQRQPPSQPPQPLSFNAGPTGSYQPHVYGPTLGPPVVAHQQLSYPGVYYAQCKKCNDSGWRNNHVPCTCPAGRRTLDNMTNSLYSDISRLFSSRPSPQPTYGYGYSTAYAPNMYPPPAPATPNLYPPQPPLPPRQHSLSPYYTQHSASPSTPGAPRAATLLPHS